MGAWAGPDDQPGPDTSLDELNALVPATEELDLLDQHREQVARAEREEAYRRDAARLDPEATTPASAARPASPNLEQSTPAVVPPGAAAGAVD